MKSPWTNSDRTDRRPIWLLGFLVLVAFLPSVSYAQFSIDWYTIDGGGGVSSGGSFELSGTIGQHDAGAPLRAGVFDLAGGFWSAFSDSCAADFNGDGAVDSRDVIAFLNAWSAREDSADCDANGVIDSRDVICFLNAWSSGC